MLLFLNRGYKNVVEGWRYKTKMLPAQSSLCSLVVARFLLGTLVVRGPAPLPLPVPLPVLALLLWGPVLALLGGLLVPENENVNSQNITAALSTQHYLSLSLLLLLLPPPFPLRSSSSSL